MQLTDYKKLPSVRIRKTEPSFFFVNGGLLPQYRATSDYLDAVLPQTQTAAFLVIRHDSIVYEKYFDGFSHTSILPSNSMAKSFTGTLVSIAVDEGKIKSLSEPVTNYLPELLKRDPAFSRITLQHLMDMRSGLDFNEGRYDIHDDAIRIGLRPNLKKHILRVKIAEPPGRFRYQSINTQLLSLVVEKATGQRLSTFLEQKLWRKMGAEHDATWNVDSRKRKQVLGSAGLNAIAADFAKLGRLYLRKGNWEGVQILNEKWVNTVSNIDTMEKYGGYKNQWWNRYAYRSFTDSTLAAAYQHQTPYAASTRRVGDGYRVNYRTASYGAIGFLNQAIYINPQKDLIIVRLGRRWQHPTMNAIQFLHELSDRL